MTKKLLIVLTVLMAVSTFCPKKVDTMVNWDIFKTKPARYYDKTVYFPSEKEVNITNCNQAYY